MPCNHLLNPMASVPDHGPRLTVEEYERRVVDMYRDGPAMPDRVEELRLRRAEFDLRIDHRLGQDFPAARREQLWAAQQRFDKRRVWHLFNGLLSPGIFKQGSDVSGPLTAALIAAYAQVLDAAELQQFFDLEARDLARLRR